MPSRLKKAISAVKDQTSISLAKVGGAESSTLEVAILKATTHDEIPVDERYVTEILQLVSSNRSYAGSCARALGRRIGRTKNWIVAVKSLILVLRIFQDGDPHFPKEVLHAMKRGYKILKLSSFRDDSSTSCPWDFTAFVRTFALYLDERLDCFLTGKLQRRTSHQSDQTRGYYRKNVPIVRDMKPAVLLDRISYWQRLLDRAIATRPTGAAKSNRLILTCLYAVVEETYELYRDISDGLALLLDSFFHLHYHNCVSAYQTCVKASKQFEELSAFYDLCKGIGVGRTSEYPSVQKISDELVETLQEFLKDQSSFPGTNGRTPGSNSLPPLSPKESETGSMRNSDLRDHDRSLSEFRGSRCTSLEDLICADSGFSPDRYSDPGRENGAESEDYMSANDAASVRSDPTDHRGIHSVLDLLTLDVSSPPPELQLPEPKESAFESNNVGASNPSSENEGWELVLFEAATQPSDHHQDTSTGFELDLFSGFNAPSTSSSPLPVENNYINPFLQDAVSDLNGANIKAHGNNGDSFGSFARTSFDASFTRDAFPAEFGLGIANSTTPNFHAEFSVNGGDQYSCGIPVDLGIDHTYSDPQTLKAVFGDAYSNDSANNVAGFPADFGIGHTSSSLPTFNVEAGKNTSEGNQGLPIDLFSDFSNANANSANFTTSPFPDNFGNSIASGTAVSSSPYNNGYAQPTCCTDVRDGNANASRGNFSPATPFSDNFGTSIASGPAVSPSAYSNELAQPTFSADVREGRANAMNAIVPFSQQSNDDFFSSGPRFQAAPTFRATSLDMDSQPMHHENDPIGSLDEESFLQQQQLWLQNQKKIMARHLT